jgi:hypothetical protein
MKELARSAAAEPAPLGYSDVFKTQAERRAELRRMRTIAAMLLVLMAAIYLAMRRAPPSWVWAPYLAAFAEAGMVGRAPIGSPWSRSFAVRLGCRFLIPRSCPRTSCGSARRWGASSPTISFPRASPSRGSRRSTLSVSRRGGSKTSATRGRLRLPPDAPFRTRSISCLKRRSTNGSLLPRDAGSRRSPQRRSHRGAYPSCGRGERARRCSTRASIS